MSVRTPESLRVFVVGGGFQYLHMFFNFGMKGARSVEDADIICFTGGADVDPSFYGEKKLPKTYSDINRDEYEKGIFIKAKKLKVPMVGVCRGAQFLNVMSGGRLWQDVNNHAIGGKHDVVDLRTGKTVSGMTSTHHQQMIEGPGAEVVAVAALSTKKVNEREVVDRKKARADDLEVVWYPDTLSLCFQPHPEFGEGSCQDYFLDLIEDYIIPAT